MTVASVAVATDSAESAAGRKRIVVASVVALVVLAAAGIGGFLIWKNSQDTQMRNAAIAASASKAAAEKAAADAEADRVRRERAKRAAAVKDVDASINTLAEKQASEGLFEGG